jgi:co-chaperonin GroES (HSP10)
LYHRWFAEEEERAFPSLRDRVRVHRIDAEQTTAGGIIIPEAASASRNDPSMRQG